MIPESCPKGLGKVHPENTSISDGKPIQKTEFPKNKKPLGKSAIIALILSTTKTLSQYRLGKSKHAGKAHGGRWDSVGTHLLCPTNHHPYRMGKLGKSTAEAKK